MRSAATIPIIAKLRELDKADCPAFGVATTIGENVVSVASNGVDSMHCTRCLDRAAFHFSAFQQFHHTGTSANQGSDSQPGTR